MSYSSRSSSTLYASSAANVWDPEVVLNLTNNATYSLSCVGYAKSCSRRCQRYIAQHKTAHGRGIIHRLARGSAAEAAESPDLPRAIDTLLCWQHTDQSASIYRQWRNKLEDWAADNEDDGDSSATLSDWGSGWHGSSSSDSDSDPDTDPDIDDWSPKKEPSFKKESTRELSPQDLRKMMKKMQENMERLEAQLRREREARRAREEGKRRAEEERRRREEQRREEERRIKEAKEKREQKAREEAFRERVRLEKEKRLREAKVKAEKDAESWQASWKRYNNAWHTNTELSAADIPWPVKSGSRSDVNEANVKLFFAKAPPEELRKSGENSFKFINKETKKWHTDKVMQRFGRDVASGDSKSALDTVAKVLIELRADAKLKRCA
ncbi:hypothetical protein F5Y04DRAFT_256275 [Hypomontagnella monticulosa]|nr:hypothetical protein F5Y04DRAFT_256275 [Hypomontagnella monticulosa]